MSEEPPRCWVVWERFGFADRRTGALLITENAVAFCATRAQAVAFAAERLDSWSLTGECFGASEIPAFLIKKGPALIGLVPG